MDMVIRTGMIIMDIRIRPRALFEDGCVTTVNMIHTHGHCTLGEKHVKHSVELRGYLQRLV